MGMPELAIRTYLPLSESFPSLEYHLRKRAPLLLLSRQPEPGLQSGRMDLPALIDTRAVDTISSWSPVMRLSI